MMTGFIAKVAKFKTLMNPFIFLEQPQSSAGLKNRIMMMTILLNRYCFFLCTLALNHVIKLIITMCSRCKWWWWLSQEKFPSDHIFLYALRLGNPMQWMNEWVNESKKREQVNVKRFSFFFENNTTGHQEPRLNFYYFDYQTHIKIAKAYKTKE